MSRILCRRELCSNVLIGSYRNSGWFRHRNGTLFCPRHIPEEFLSRCSAPDCESHIRNNAWSKIKAHDAGWFSQKSGELWCPDHLPEWVHDWRIKQIMKKES